MSMTSTGAPTLRECFGDLPDPRVARTRRHHLFDIVSIAILGALSGADTWVDIEAFGRAKITWLRTFLELPNGIPSHDTFGRVFARIDPEAFRSGFTTWVKGVRQATEEVIAIDGKAVRHSHDRLHGRAAIQMVSAWATKSQLVLGQVKVDSKSNEITAIPELLQLVDVSGCIVTIDAMGCQREIAAQIREGKGHYMLALKDNQRRLYRRVQDHFRYAREANFAQVNGHDRASRIEKGHGRIERRTCWTISDPNYINQIQGDLGFWQDLKSLVMIEAERHIDGQVSTEVRYYIASLLGQAKQALDVTREHWGIENELHWVLDVAFREDESRVRVDHAPQNLALIRHLALNMLSQDKSTRMGTRAKIGRAHV